MDLSTEPFHHAAPEAQEAESDFNLSEYLQVLRRRWRLVAVMALLGTLGGLFHYLTTPKRYQAKTRILIERRSVSPVANQFAWMYEVWDPQFYPTQYKLLESRGLAERVVLDLRLFEDPKFHSAALPKPSDGSLGGSAALDKVALAGLAQKLRAGLAVKPVADTQLVDIIYRHGDAEFARRVANGYAAAFEQEGISTRYETATRASTFLEAQIEALKDEISEKEKLLRAYGRESDLVALDPDSDVNLQRFEAINGDYMKARSERIQKEVHYNELVTAPSDRILDRHSDQVIRTLESQQAALEQEYAGKLEIYKPEWPPMVELKAQIDKGRERLDEVIDDVVRKARESARAEYQSALRGEAALKKELDEMKSEMLDQDVNAVQYNNLKVELSSLRQLLDQMLQRQSETGVAVRGSRESTVRVIEEALTPTSPYQPDRRKDLSAGFGVGILLGIGLVLLLEFTDRSIKTGEELERRLGLPTLAVISDVSESRGRYGYLGRYGYGADRRPRSKSRKKAGAQEETGMLSPIELLPQTRPRLAVSEAYRALRTALLLSTADELRVLVITSATAGEGKTATASNLATVMAQLGRRVLLIDADLRKPRLHQIFKVSNRSGVVSYLVGRAGEDEVFRTNGIPNLVVAPSGPIPPNPSELLSSDRMRDLVEDARSRFDFVIIDTPPALAVTDSTLMGDIADGVVLCVQAGKVSRTDVKACRDRLRLAGVKILGTVLNRYRPLAGRYGKAYYYYSYRYEAYDESNPPPSPPELQGDDRPA